MVAAKTKIPDPKLCGQFESVAATVQSNLSLAIDLVIVHNERRVSGPQPRVSLNWGIVIATMSAWERFIVDTVSMFAGSKLAPHDLDRAKYAGPAAKLLTKVGATDTDFLSRLPVHAATNWSGIRLRAMEDLIGTTAGQTSGLTFEQHLNQWVTFRNALAHHGVPRLLARSENPSTWTDPMIGDPYKSVTGERFRLWEYEIIRTDPVYGDQRYAGASTNAGCVRGCLALVIQAVDWLIADICQAHGRSWDTTYLRLPGEWFQRRLPPKYRGARAANHVNWSLWGGATLYRHP
jgi:hypothetical protein